jgi:thiamine biosynthesis lipoprotein
MGTLFHLTLYAPDPVAARTAADAAFHRVAALEEIMSDYQADSELMRLCDQPYGRPVHVSAELFEILQRAREFSELSRGAFDVTVGPYVRLWRFSRKRQKLPAAAELQSARQSVGFDKIRLDRRARTVTLLASNMRLDLGGIAKGYAADQVLALLQGRGLTRALIAASGDIAIGDPPPDQSGWKIGIAPMDARTNETVQTVWLRNAGISTSGDSAQMIELEGVRYSHIVNPATGLGLTNRVQVTVIARDATTTDALATAISILGPGEGLALVEKLPRTAAIVFTEGGHQRKPAVSRRWPR